MYVRLQPVDVYERKQSNMKDFLPSLYGQLPLSIYTSCLCLGMCLEQWEEVKGCVTLTDVRVYVCVCFAR